MTISTFIIDDEPHAIDVLKKYIGMTPGLQLRGSALDPLQALREITSLSPPDLTFVDVDMPVLTGIELAGLINRYTRVVFTTSYREYGVEAFEKNALDYLLKPFSYERFLGCIQKFRELQTGRQQTDPNERSALFISGGTKGKLIKVLPDELIHAEGAQNFVRLHFATESLLVYLTLQEVLEKLPGNHFARIHKSHIVNVLKIKSVEGGQVRMENQAVIPIGRTYQDAFNGLLRELVLSRDHPQDR